MLKTLIHYQIYIIIGILVFPIFAFITYLIKKMIDRLRFVKELNNIKKPLMERINNIEAIYEIKEKNQEMNIIIETIKSDIQTLKQEIQISQEVWEANNIDKIEEEITRFYERMQNPKKMEENKKTIPVPERDIVKETPQHIYQQAVIQQQEYQLQAKQQQTTLHKEQIKVMNENISKFLVVYREKDKVIEDKNRALDEKNKSIYVLQQKLQEAEARLKRMIAEHEGDSNKDKIIEERTKTISILQQRLQEVENKFKKIAILHKSITEKEQMKDAIIDEKNRFIANLQGRLTEIEQKLQNIVMINENNKENFLNSKLLDIDEQIKIEKKKNRILIIAFIIFLIIII